MQRANFHSRGIFLDAYMTGSKAWAFFKDFFLNDYFVHVPLIAVATDAYSHPQTLSGCARDAPGKSATNEAQTCDIVVRCELYCKRKDVKLRTNKQ